MLHLQLTRLMLTLELSIAWTGKAESFRQELLLLTKSTVSGLTAWVEHDLCSATRLSMSRHVYCGHLTHQAKSGLVRVLHDRYRSLVRCILEKVFFEAVP